MDSVGCSRYSIIKMFIFYRLRKQQPAPLETEIMEPHLQGKRIAKKSPPPDSAQPDNLPDFLILHKSLTDRHHMHCWTNSETFDRDMPIRFLPIKWEKLLLKLQAAKAAGVEKGLTFEFSHFMSPNSCYQAAHGLYDRYCEYFGIQ